jgi:drug/metabolite transporter (DMT)-like permease
VSVYHLRHCEGGDESRCSWVDRKVWTAKVALKDARTYRSAAPIALGPRRQVDAPGRAARELATADPIERIHRREPRAHLSGRRRAGPRRPPPSVASAACIARRQLPSGSRGGADGMLTVVLGVSTALLWGVPDVALAVAVRRIGATAMLAGSLVLGTLLVVPVAFFVPRPGFTHGALALAIGDGLLMVGAYGIAYSAFARCPVSVVTPIISCEGAAAAAIAIAFGERPGNGILALLVAAVIGVVLVGTAGHAGRVSPSGLALAIVAAVMWGGVLFLSGPVTDRLGGFWGFLTVRSAASLVMVPFLARPAIRRGIRTEPWRLLIWTAGDTGGNLCYFAAAAAGPVALASVLGAQFAVFGTLAGVILLGERLRRHQWVGVAIVLGAVSGIAALSA